MLYRFEISLAIPEAAYDAIPAARKLAFRDAVRALKAYAVKINAGAANEEMTVKAVFHKCHHDGNQPCEPEVEI